MGNLEDDLNEMFGLGKEKNSTKSIVREETLPSIETSNETLSSIEEIPTNEDNEDRHFKTDTLRTSYQLLSGATVRGNPEIIKSKMIRFLESYKPTLIKNKWYWKKIGEY